MGANQEVPPIDLRFGRKTYCIKFDLAAYNLIMRRLRGRPVDRVWLTPWNSMAQTGLYQLYDDGSERIDIYLGNCGPSPLAFPPRAREIKSNILKVLAHESRHACQPEKLLTDNHGAWPGIIASIIISGAWLWYMGVLVFDQLVKSIVALSIMLTIFWSAALAVVFITGLVLFGFAVLWLPYKLSPAELDADWFAFRAVRQAEWQNLISVEEIKKI